MNWKRLKELREEQGNDAAELRKLSETLDTEKRGMTPEETAKFDEIYKGYNERKTEIEQLEKMKQIDDDVNNRSNQDFRENRAGNLPSDQAELRSLALHGWALTAIGDDVNEQHREAAQAFGLDFRANVINMNLATKAPQSVEEVRAMSSEQGSLGGIMVPVTMMNQFELAKVTYGSVSNVAQVLRTETGEEIDWPGADDTSNEGEMIGENKDAGDADDIEFKAVKWRSYAFSSKVIKVPYSLIRDAAMPLETFLGEIMGKRITRAMNRKFTLGTGNAQPMGIVSAATAGKTAAAVDELTPDELIDFTFSVDEAYRKNGKWMMNDKVILVISKLKYSDGTYVWQRSFREGSPDRILNYPYEVNNFMPDTLATGVTAALFGDLAQYKVREVRGIRIKRLVERYAESDQIGFIAYQSGDGNLLDMGDHPVKSFKMA